MKKAIGAFLSIVLFANLSFASLGDDFWKERRRVSGPVTHDSSPKTTPRIPTVFIIKDIHSHREAQNNVRRHLDRITRATRIDVIGLEGAFGPIDISDLKDFPHKQSVRAAADFLFEQKKISGPIHWALNSATPVPAIVGIDDEDLYGRNIEAFKKAFSKSDSLAAVLIVQKQKLDARKNREFNAELKTFDQMASGYAAGHVSILDFAVTLNRLEPGNARIAALAQAAAMEKSLDFNQVEKERAEVLAQLLSFDRSAAARLLALGATYGKGEMAHDDFYRELALVCSANSISLKSYPSLRKYMSYVSCIEKAHLDSIVHELASVEGRVYRRLSRSDSERQLVAESHKNYLLGQLTNFSLMRNEWDEYVALKISAVEEFGPDGHAFELFYEMAALRDAALAREVLISMDGKQAAIVVAGGFHVPYLSARLSEKGIRVISVTPDISSTTDADTMKALSLFARESTPLEKLFQKEKVYLSLPPFDPSVENAAKVMALAHVEASTPGDMPPAQEQMLAQNIGLNKKFEAHDAAAGVADFSVRGDDGSVEGRIGVTNDGRIETMTSRLLGRHRVNSARMKSAVAGKLHEAVYAYKNKKRRKKKAHRGQNLQQAYLSALERYPELKGRRINLRIVNGAQYFGSLTDNVIMLDEKLLDNPFLLERVLREEFHHLLFKFLLTTLWHRTPTREQLAAEELHTDLSHLRAFLSLTDEHKQAGIIRFMFKESHDQRNFYVLLLKILNPNQRAQILKILKGDLVDSEHRKLASIVDGMNALPSEDQVVMGAELESWLIRLLLEYYIKENIYPDLTDEYRKGNALVDVLRTYRSDWDSLREEYRNRMDNPPELHLGDVTFYTDPGLLGSQIGAKSLSEDLIDLEAMVGQKDVVVIEPHPDDVAIAMGSMMSQLRSLSKSLNLISAVPDHLGVPDRYIKRRFQPEAESDLHELKRYVRETETAAFAKDVLKSPADDHFSSLQIQFPLLRAHHATDASGRDHFVGYLSEWEGFDGPTGQQYVERVRRTVDIHRDAQVWFLPYPFVDRRHHPHHSAISLQFLKELKAIDYSGRVIFYETFEAETDFDDDNIVPNLIYRYGRQDALEKEKLIGHFKSQTDRRDYAGLALARDKKNYEKEMNRRQTISTAKTEKYAERFVVGHLIRTPADGWFGKWPFLTRFYNSFGDGLVANVALPVLVESILPALALSYFDVSSLRLLVLVQVLWLVLHGRGALSVGKTMATLSGVGLLTLTSTGLLVSYALPHLVLNLFHFSRAEERLANDVVDEIVARSKGQSDPARVRRLAQGFSQALPLSFDLGKMYSDNPRRFDRLLFHSALTNKLRQKGLSETTLKAALAQHQDHDLIVIPVHDSLSISELTAIFGALSAQKSASRGVAFVGEIQRPELSRLLEDYLSRTPRAAYFQGVGLLDSSGGTYSLDLIVLERVLGGLLETSTGVQFLIDGRVDVRSAGLRGDSLLMRALFSIFSEDMRVITVGISQLNAIKAVSDLISSQA